MRLRHREAKVECSARATHERFEGDQRSLSFFGQFAGTSAGATFERAADVWAHGIDATNESAARFDAQGGAMAVLDLHVATIAYEMRVGPGRVVHAVVIDAEYANVFGERGETTGAAEEAIGGDQGEVPTNYGQGVGQAPPQSLPISSPFCTASVHAGARQTPALHTPL